MIEQNTTTSDSSFQPHENRVIRATILFSEGARLLHEESFDLLNLRQAARLRVISNALQRLASALQRIGRATKPDAPSEGAGQQFVLAGGFASREAVL